MRNSKANQKGITLIALIITIIVMLILVGVSVNIALNNGIFKAAQKAAKDTETEKTREQELADGKITVGDKTYNSIDDYVYGSSEPEQPTVKNPTKNLKIGSKLFAVNDTMKFGDLVTYYPESFSIFEYTDNYYGTVNAVMYNGSTLCGENRRSEADNGWVGWNGTWLIKDTDSIKEAFTEETEDLGRQWYKYNGSWVEYDPGESGTETKWESDIRKVSGYVTLVQGTPYEFSIMYEDITTRQDITLEQI